MQTFLPFADFNESARVLDNKRLGKQRVENLQIATAIFDPYYGWQNHPAVGMWRGYEECLFYYHINICGEWVARGFTDTCYHKMIDLYNDIGPGVIWIDEPRTPPWLGDEDFHASHRSNLKRKDPVHYAQFTEPDNLPYVWPKP